MLNNEIFERPQRERLLDEHDLSAWLNRAVSSIQKDRLRGTGPRFLRIGRLIRYKPADVSAWLAAQPTLTSTSDEAA